MKFIDRLYDTTVTISEIYSDWKEMRMEDSENHAPNFKTEMFEILMATVNGRNDLEIVGMKASEVERLIARLRRAIS